MHSINTTQTIIQHILCKRSLGAPGRSYQLPPVHEARADMSQRLKNNNKDSFCWPKVVFVRDFNALSFLLALAFMLFMYWVKVMCVSSVRPRSFGYFSNESNWLKSVTLGYVYDSCLSGVKSVIIDFVGDADILFCTSHRFNECMYYCRVFAASYVLGYCEAIDRSSA